MKYLAFVVLFISLLFACDTDFMPMDQSISLKGAYILTHIMIDNQLEAVDASKVSLNTNTKTIAFYVTGSLEGRFMGHTLNNGSGMEYKLISKNKLKLFNFGGTRAGEGRYGLALMNHIGSHNLFHYTLTKDRLVISDTLDTELMVFQKQFVPGELPAASQNETAYFSCFVCHCSYCLKVVGALSNLLLTKIKAVSSFFINGISFPSFSLMSSTVSVSTPAS